MKRTKRKLVSPMKFANRPKQAGADSWIGLRLGCVGDFAFRSAVVRLLQRSPTEIPRGFIGTLQRGDRALDGADIDLREFVRGLRRSDSEEAAFVGVAHAVAPHA